jgi:O-antigen ligase
LIATIAAAGEWGLDFCAVLLLPLLALVPHAVAPLTAFAGLCAAGLVATNPPDRFTALHLPAACVVALLLWGFASTLWSIEPQRSLVLAMRLAGLFAAGLALAAAAERIAAPRRLAMFLVAGLALGVALVWFELGTGGSLINLISVRGFGPYRLDQIAIGLAILAPPVTAWMSERGGRVPALLAGVAAITTIGFLDDLTAKAALVAALPMSGLLYWRKRPVARVAAVLCALFILTAPLTLSKLERIPGLFAAADSFKVSAGHRLLIWSFTGDRIAEQPLLGWGLDSSRAIPGGNAEMRPGQNWLPLHPHDAALQVWLELGLPGAALFALLLALFWLRLDRLSGPRLYAAAAGGALAASLAPLFAAYGVWQEWWIGTLALALFFVLVLAREADTCSPAPATRPPQRGWRAAGR